MSKVIEEIELQKYLGSPPFFWENGETKPECKEIIPGKGWAIENVFSEEECQKLIDLSNKIGFESLIDEYDPEYRNNTRFMLNSKSFGQELLKRIKNYTPTIAPVTLNNDSWEVDSLNERFRICKYEKNGIFKIHQDGSYRPSYDFRSFYTCMLYLNETDGGDTRFFEDYEGKYLITKLPPKPGQVLLFDPDVYHDGDRVISGEKYIIRTEVMYKIKNPKHNHKERDGPAKVVFL